MQPDKPSNWNLPNVLTSLRILFIPVFAWLVLSERWWWAFGLFAALMITDKLDGDIARARGLITDLSLIHISEPTRLHKVSRMPSSA